MLDALSVFRCGPGYLVMQWFLAFLITVLTIFSAGFTIFAAHPICMSLAWVALVSESINIYKVPPAPPARARVARQAAPLRSHGPRPSIPAAHGSRRARGGRWADRKAAHAPSVAAGRCPPHPSCRAAADQEPAQPSNTALHAPWTQHVGDTAQYLWPRRHSHHQVHGWPQHVAGHGESPSSATCSVMGLEPPCGHLSRCTRHEKRLGCIDYATHGLRTVAPPRRTLQRRGVLHAQRLVAASPPRAQAHALVGALTLVLMCGQATVGLLKYDTLVVSGARPRRAHAQRHVAGTCGGRTLPATTA